MAAPVTEELPSSSLKQVDVLPTSTTAEPPISPITLKRISPQESPQKLLSKKKPKMISSPNDAVNKQASRLWQWLQKPGELLPGFNKFLGFADVFHWNPCLGTLLMV
jgi:hypothetical protein